MVDTGIELAKARPSGFEVTRFDPLNEKEFCCCRTLFMVVDTGIEIGNWRLCQFRALVHLQYLLKGKCLR